MTERYRLHSALSAPGARAESGRRMKAAVAAAGDALFVLPASSRAQSPVPAASSADDEVINIAQPDYTIINLPTTRRLQPMKSAVRITHRFGLSLTRGSFGQAAENLFAHNLCVNNRDEIGVAADGKCSRANG